MKANYLYIIMGFVWAGMMACTEEVPNMQMEEEASRIYLSAGVGGRVSSRAPYYYKEGENVLTTPTVEHPLGVSVWASTTAGAYPDSKLNGSTGTVEIHTNAHFQSGNPQLLGEAIYPQKGQNGQHPSVYFVGLHPQSENWATLEDDHSKALYTFTGMEDVMFAPQISGTYGTDFENSPTFHFYHLLTWLRIEMAVDKYMQKEEGEEEKDITLKKDAIRQAWGKIERMTISSKNKVVVDLTKLVNSDATELPADVATFSENLASFNFYQTGTDNVFPVTEGSDIPIDETEVAYVMCAPVDAEYKASVQGYDEEILIPEYTLTLKTSNRNEMTIPIDLKINSGTEESSYFTGSTMGKQFTILLNFKMGNVISVAADISLAADTEWFTHGTGTSELEEKHFVENENNTTNQPTE